MSSLLTRLSRLRSVQSTVSGDQQHDPRLLDLSQQTHQGFAQLAAAAEQWSNTVAEVSFDKHFVVPHANPTCWQFFGSSSVYALAVEVLVHAQAKFGTLTHRESYLGSQFWLNAQTPEEKGPPRTRATPERAEVEMLVSLYLQTTNQLFCFIDQDTVSQDIEIYLMHHGPLVRTLTGRDAHQFFRVSMVCAIAAANKARHRSSYAAESMQYYAEALQCVEEVTSDVSADALIALVLLIAFSFFYPRKGDVWKLLDFACRLSVELNYHTETNDHFEDEKSRMKRRSMFWGLYTVERTIGQHFGRPSDLPEEIITVEYPGNMIDIATSDPEKQQVILQSHYYRLTYLRSEIFRELYLPAATPNLPHIWYEQRLANILSWRDEMQVDTVSGMGSITCDMGVDTSICFLFQPLILRALNATRELTLSHDSREIVPRESYYSACGTIEHYKKILRAPEDHPYGMYPLTMISAHYIQTAAMTIMAHCLLAIDGRVPTTSFIPEQGATLSGAIDFRNIYDVSGSCLILLSKLAERWPGMVGMLDIYKSLSDKILPVMMRAGLG